MIQQAVDERIFQSTLPTRGSDIARLPPLGMAYNFNPRSPRGGATAQFDVSLLARDISIHAPHEGERPLNAVAYKHTQIFQSTLPTRGSDPAICGF